MGSKTTQESIQLFYVRWTKDMPLVCTQCGSPIEFLYNDGGRTVITLQGKIKLYTCYYICTNKACTFSLPFTLPHAIVLPYKHFGLDVWHWVITSHVRFHDSYSSIVERLQAYFELEISLNTVKAIVETFLVANSQEADQETAHLVKESGKIYLSLDGQRPNNGEAGLWLFIDTITNRIVHMEYLKTAPWAVLASIFQTIEKKYGVPIKAVLSDRQQNIEKAVKEALPGVPHQFCHYHFLKNVHGGINASDSHLHLQLAVAINQLSICNLSLARSAGTFQERELLLQDWITPIVTDLTRLLRGKTRDFDIFAGFNLYEHLAAYVPLVEQLLTEVKPLKRLYKLLERTVIQLRKALSEVSALYLKLKPLIPLFHELRGIFGAEPAAPGEMHALATTWQAKLRDLYKASTGHELAEKLKYKRITAESPLEEILAEWFRLYSTHESGLFHFQEVSGLPRSNVALEQLFSLETSHFRKAVGHAQVGNMVRVKGGEVCIVLQNFDPDIIDRVLLTSDKKEVKQAREKFRIRQKQQANSWYYKKEKPPEIIQLVKKAHELHSNE